MSDFEERDGVREVYPRSAPLKAPDLTDAALREKLDELELLGAGWEMATDALRLAREIEGKKSEIIGMFNAARAEQREADVKALCTRCERGVPVHWERKRKQWEHDLTLTNPTNLRCDAAAIRAQEPA